ncbi:MAG: energy-coupling factor transporter transmembrane protein EcfT [Synergistaceae bacterium]|nr:energy-coupling factor transporter transmembrane protein EcfT [Synergistaceae bacterium]
MRGFLDYAEGDTALHRLNPVTKLFLAFGLTASCFVTQNHAAIASIAALELALGAMAGIQERAVRIFSSLVKLAVILFLVQVFFARQGNVVFAFSSRIYVTDFGLSFSGLFALRLIAATMPLAFMLSITRMSDISNVLVRYFRVPYKYAFVLTTAMRFIPLFAEEMNGIVEAQTARGVEFDTKSFVKKIRLMIPLCVPLLVSSVRRVEVGAISAELRGFNLRKASSGYKRYGFGANDAAAVAAGIAVIIICAAV